VVVADVEKGKWEVGGETTSFYSRLKLVCECYDSVDELLCRASETIFTIRKA
jgi:hypothetical protein